MATIDEEICEVKRRLLVDIKMYCSSGMYKDKYIPYIRDNIEILNFLNLGKRLELENNITQK